MRDIIILVFYIAIYIVHYALLYWSALYSGTPQCGHFWDQAGVLIIEVSTFQRVYRNMLNSSLFNCASILLFFYE